MTEKKKLPAMRVMSLKTGRFIGCFVPRARAPAMAWPQEMTGKRQFNVE
ncbi:hypothetical protein [Acerihabitans sp.]